ncbi:MAG: flagellar basal body-associated FliL family protein [Heliobacteriaceae bacterium]|nr:flagellar basal body-associated FliL family protein [Heliobacteriaceae bacterium]
MAETENTPQKRFPIDFKLVVIAVLVLVAAAVIALGIFKFLISPEALPGGLPGKTSPARPLGVLFEVGEFRTNLADPGGRRYLQAKVSLELNEEKKDEKKIAELEENKAIIRDRILTVFRSKTVEDFQANEGLDKIKKEILIILNKQFGADKFRNVYFLELVYQ